MTPLLPLDGPCTQLLLSSAVCSKWLLTRKWKTSANLLCWPRQHWPARLVPGKSAFTASFMHRVDQRLYMLGNCTIISLSKQICFPHCTRPENIISVSQFGMGEVTSSVSRLIGKATAVTHRVQYVLLGWGSDLLTRLFAPLTPDAAITSPTPASNRRAMCRRGDKFTQVKTTSHCGVRLVTHCLVLDTHSCRCHDGFPSQGLT